jgi:UDP-glucuronate decarboxylase
MRNGNARRVLVAGGGGFIGSHLCDALLADGANVICLDNFLTGRVGNLSHLAGDVRFQIIHADIMEPLPGWLRVDEIYNLACAASPPHYQADPIHTLMTSVVGTRNLLAFAADTGARFLQASTSEVYGDPEIHPQSESYFGNVNPTGPRACYDEGKRAAEALCFDYARAGRVAVRVARIFNTYGPRMRSDDGRVISNLVTQALAGRGITVNGDGQQTRSFCYVDDLIIGLQRLMAHEGELPGPVNLGNPSEITMSELAALVLKMTGSRSRILRQPLPVDDPRRRRPDISLAKRLLHWSPQIPLETGLRRTIKWFEAAASGGRRNFATAQAMAPSEAAVVSNG